MFSLRKPPNMMFMMPLRIAPGGGYHYLIVAHIAGIVNSFVVMVSVFMCLMETREIPDGSARLMI